MRKRWVWSAALAALAGCVSSSDDVDQSWYEQAEIVCYRPACGRCAGAGHVACGPCGGVGWERCGRCRGGRVRCGTCKGDGSYKGKRCGGCGGDGLQTCSRCGGDSRVECEVCAARGRLHCLRPLRVSEPPPGPDDVWPRKMP
jgi:hypothetical protein